jgi:alkylation response protein AidB-like acyl-CoA dehydrogenase
MARRQCCYCHTIIWLRCSWTLRTAMMPSPSAARDAKLLEIGAGTTEIRKLIIARELLGLR